MSTIPANQLVAVEPSVLGAGGGGVDVIGLVLTTNTRIPIGTVQSFPDAGSVEDYFGANTTESIIAGGGTNLGTGYFGGFTNAAKRPGSILFSQYNADDVAAFMRGGDVSALTLTQLQAISGSLNIVIDGAARNAPTVNLSASTSFSSAAGIIQAALIAAAPSAASVTGSIGGVVTASAGAAFTGNGSGTNLTVSAIAGVLHVGAQLSGTGVPAGTYIVSQTSGTAGSNGVYVTNHATTSAGDALVATSNILDLTAVSSGTMQATDAISGSGVASGSTILAQLSGSPGGIGLYTLSSSQHIPSATVTSLSTVLNVTAVGSGTVETGAVLAGTNVASGTSVVSGITGTGGTGTYRVSAASTTVSETITSSAADPVVTYDSVSGAFIVTSGIEGASSAIAYATGTIASSVKLTAATGAVLSQGADAAVPGSFMDALTVVTSNWVTYFTAFDPDDGSGNDVKQAFAAWTTAQNDRFAYIAWDTDVTPTANLPATGSLGYLLAQNGNSGTCLIDGEPALWTEALAMNTAAFISGAAASIDFTERNGRISFAYKAQAGLLATTTDPTVAANLGGNPQVANSFGNGYNFYGAYGTANPTFLWFQRGLVTGPFRWLDSYINQIWLNNAFQVALLQLQQNARSIPYSTAGNALIEAALADPIQAGLNFGAFAPGALSQSQIAAVNTAAGANIAGTLQTQGYYLQILPAVASTRAARTSPPCTFWYIDNGSIQSITLASVALT